MPSSPEIQTEPIGRIVIGKITVGATEVACVLAPNVRTRSVLFEPDDGNAGEISIGETGIVIGTDGLPLYGPRAFDVNLAAGNVFAIATQASQVLWLACLVDEAGQ